MMTAPSEAGRARHRHYAGVLVTADPQRFDAALAALATLGGVSLHRLDRATGRCVAVLETVDRADQEDLFRRLRELPAVRDASLVYHLVDDEAELALVPEDAP